MSLFDSKNVKIIEINVDENNQRLDDVERTNVHLAEKLTDKPVKKEKKLKYAWLFFFGTILAWSSVTHALHLHGMKGMGVAMGLLFFVPNVYNKVMEKINNL